MVRIFNDPRESATMLPSDLSPQALGFPLANEEINLEYLGFTAFKMAATASAVDDLFWGAAANLRANLPPSGDSILYPDAPEGQINLGLLQLPGKQSDAKAVFERELLALIRHVSLLQDGTLLDHASPLVPGIITPNHVHLNMMINKKDIDGDPEVVFTTDTDIVYLEKALEEQDKEIRLPRKLAANVLGKLIYHCFPSELDYIEEELLKAQEMNKAFRKALQGIGKIITQVANGDLSTKVPMHSLEMNSDIITFKITMNTMLDQLRVFGREVSRVAWETINTIVNQLRTFANEVNRVARDVGIKGVLIREIADVTTAVAKGDLTKKITANVNGEILDLKETINSMVCRLNQFAVEVCKVAREVGIDGTLGGQAVVTNVEGEWKVLTDNVNMMADNLTS
ncbi:hypothetical protein N7530_006025 [Penicillium desertorum]|uniref:HAMP domain-containing protein n=1 Tax=Penicillium desertorum TaxID=1303715 RepID=A0A9X0BSE1_9EURO|nr:hypothetical protein N7530_006025 [Penicillium desertorum]